MKHLTDDDLKWIERFWEGMTDIKRPADYIERAQRVLSGEFIGKRRIRDTSKYKKLGDGYEVF